MADIVRSFNGLNRPERTPGGLLNHWSFNTESLTHCQTEPKQILSLPTLDAQCDVVVPLLLEAFVNSLKNPAQQSGKIAPWSWATNSHILARAIETKLRALGVREELCTIQPRNKKQEERSDEFWAAFIDHSSTLASLSLPAVTPGRMVCGSCKKDESWISAGLLKCSACGSAYYCSRNYQRQEWKEHKNIYGKAGTPTDQPETSASTRALALDPVDYYNQVAHSVPEAKSLADSINLSLPPPSQELLKPILHLVISGKDTPENLALLSGPKWESVSNAWRAARLDVLLDPPPGSRSYVMQHCPHNEDKNLPRTPRPASAQEKGAMHTVREIQRRLSLGPRLSLEMLLKTENMVATLMTFGVDWNIMVPLYHMAVNTMDLDNLAG